MCRNLAKESVHDPAKEPEPTKEYLEGFCTYFFAKKIEVQVPVQKFVKGFLQKAIKEALQRSLYRNACMEFYRKPS